MAQKVAVTGSEGYEKLMKGVDFLADGVKSTLGPYGRLFLLEKGNKASNDGITIARELVGSIEDDIERRGATYVLEASSKVNDELGEGTTTAMTLSQAVIREGNRLTGGTISSKMSVRSFKNKLEEEKKIVIEKIDALATPITSEEQLIQSALVSVENDELATMIGKAQWELGPEGWILAEETAFPVSSYERITGLRVDNGFGSSFIVNNQEKEALEVKNVKVIYTNHTVKDIKVFRDVLQSLNAVGVTDVIIMARAFTEEAIRQCLEHMKNGFNVYPLNAPYTDHTEIMYDLQAILGGSLINSEERGLDSVQLSDVGFATSVLAKRYSTVFTGLDDEATKERVAKRVDMLTKKLDGSKSSFEKVHLSTRIAQLTNGFGLLMVGARTEQERKYLKDKVDDAVNAVRIAYQEGTVSGAGQALKAISDELPEDFILKRVLAVPYEQIMRNAGETFEVDEWVRDPVKVLRVCLEVATSLAGTFVALGGAVATKTEKPVCCAKQNAQEGVE